MAHNLADRADGNGKSFFGVLTGGWHELGRVIGQGIINTVDDALEAAGANFTVSTRPAHYETADGRDFLPMPEGYRAIVRDDTGAFLGWCKGRYFVQQGRVVYGIPQVLVDKGLASWETGGVLGVGERIFGSVKFNLPSHMADVFGANGLVPYGTVASSHDGSLATSVYNTTVRTVCENTLYMGLAASSQVVRVKHTATGEVKLVDAAMKVWQKVLAQHEEAATAFKALRAYHLDSAMFRKLVLDVAIPLPVIDKTATDRAQKVQATKLDNAIDTRNVITSLWHNGSGHDGDSSAYEAWQGLIQAVDHNNIMPLRSSDIVSANLFGTHGNVKAAVFQSLMAVAGK